MVKFIIFVVVLFVALLASAPLNWVFYPVAIWLHSEYQFTPLELFFYGVPIWFVIVGLISVIIQKTAYAKMYRMWADWDRFAGVRWAIVLNWLINTDEYKFGNLNNTVSAVLGANLENSKTARMWDWLFTRVADREPLKNGSTHCYDSYMIELKRGYGVFKK